MGLVESLFKNQINKAVNSQLATQFATNYAKELNSLVAFMNTGLPTINPDAADYHSLFKTVGAIYETTDIICKKGIASPFIFYKVTDKAKLTQSKRLQQTDPVQSYLLKLQATKEVDSPGLMDLLNNPNPYQTGQQWAWSTMLSYLLQGNTYLHGNKVGKRVKELYCFPNMEIVADMEDLLDPIRGYILMNSNRTPFEKDSIYHIKTGTSAGVDKTFEYLYGVSPLRAYLEPIRTIKEASTQSSKQAKNGGAFGILSPRDKEDQLDADQKKQLHDKMSQARRSDDEMARVFASSISLLWQNIGLPIADLKLIELMKASEMSVYRAFHVPPQYYDASSGTFNNQSTAVKQLIYDAVAPVCDAFSDALTRFVAPGYGVDIIEMDYTQLPEMAVNMKEVADYIIPLVKEGLISPDEGRLALRYGETGKDFMQEFYLSSAATTRQRVFDGSNQTPPVSMSTT